MRIGLILGAILLGVISCLKPRLDELDFFEVNMEQPVPVAVGEIVLKGNLVGAVVHVEACGFYYSTSFDSLSLNSIANADSIQSVLPSNSLFEAKFVGVLQNQTIFFRSFARQGRRTVYSDIRPYSLGQLIRLNGTPARSNDTLIVSGLVSGIKSQGLEVKGYGHVYAPANVSKLPAIGQTGSDSTDLGALNDDLVFTSRKPGLLFNTTYFVRAYIRTDSMYYYSETVDSILIEDGWKQLGTIGPYHGGIGVGVDSIGKAFVGFGDDNFSYQNALPDNFDTYTPDTTGGMWEPGHTTFSTVFKCTDAAVFEIGHMIYVFGGEAQLGDEVQFPNGYFKKYNIITREWSVDFFQLPPRRSRAVAFVINSKGYIGTGSYYDTSDSLYKQRNDFWEYTPASNSWRKVASMPQKIGANAVTYDGRQNAAVFSDSSRVFVGGGLVGATFLKDFWKFTPPVSPQDTGKWEPVSTFPDVGRTEAAYFTINGRGYYGLGFNGSSGTLSDFYEFDFNNPQDWKPVMTTFPGGRRQSAISFSLLDRGYVLGGVRNFFTGTGNTTDELLTDFWQYIPKQ